MSRAARGVADALALGLLPAALLACAVFRLPASGLLTLLAAVLALALFFAGWEADSPGLRQLLPAATLSAIAVAGRVLFAALPNVQPVTAVCIIAGASFGRRCGFMVGATTGLVSGFFLGIGAWTPWQMYAWGTVGYLAGALFCRPSRRSADALAGKVPGVGGSRRSRAPLSVLVFGFLASFAYGFVMNTWTLVGFVGIEWGSVLAVYGAGFAFDAAHAASTVAFLAVLYVPWARKLDRIGAKYGSDEPVPVAGTRPAAQMPYWQSDNSSESQ